MPEFDPVMIAVLPRSMSAPSMVCATLHAATAKESTLSRHAKKNARTKRALSY
jgi:hypothetical protein